MAAKDRDVGYGLVALQVALGALAFVFFYGAVYAGVDGLMTSTAVTALLVNLLVSLLATLRGGLRGGVLAAIAFAVPAILLSIFAIGDWYFYGYAGPFLYWMSAVMAVVAAGLLGVLLACTLFGRRVAA